MCGSYEHPQTSTEVLTVGKSQDAGESWSVFTPDKETKGICKTLAIDPANSNILYAGGGNKIYKTKDSGQTWSPISKGITGQVKVLSIINHKLYAGTNEGLFASVNGGESFEKVSLLIPQAIIGHRGSIYLGTATGLYKDFTLIHPIEAISSLEVNPDQYLFIGSKKRGIFRLKL